MKDDSWQKHFPTSLKFSKFLTSCEGTRPGFSLSYEIITKGHGGTLSVHATEGEGTAFTIQLSIK